MRQKYHQPKNSKTNKHYLQPLEKGAAAALANPNEHASVRWEKVKESRHKRQDNVKKNKERKQMIRQLSSTVITCDK